MARAPVKSRTTGLHRTVVVGAIGLMAACAAPGNPGGDNSSPARDSWFDTQISIDAQPSAPPETPPNAPSTPPVPAEPLTEQQQRQLQIFSLTVLNPSAEITSEVRRNAAQELLAMGVPEAIEVLDQGLRSQKPAVILAVVNAMQTAVTPVESLRKSALAALLGAPDGVVESLSWAVARYGSDALKQVAEMALNRAETPAARLGPIQALSAFEGQAAAASLMRIVNNPDESAELVSAACDGLQRLSGLSHGPDVAAWRVWWKEAGALPAGQWSAYITKSLSKRAAQLQQDLQKQREANDNTSRELFGAYRDLFPALATDEQLRRLPGLMQHSLAPVREFALGRVSVLLQDSVRIPPEVQQKVADRLLDESPALRAQAARTLHEMNYEGIGTLIATRVSTETTPAVVSAFLDILIKRPARAAVEPAKKWLGDAELGEKAARVIWRTHETDALPAETLSSLRTDLRKLFQQRNTPSITRLLAWIGDDSDVAALTGLLDGENPALRGAVAEGFAQRGLRQPLIPRAADPSIYPFAIQAVADGPADVASLRLLINWSPTDATSKMWNDGVARLLGRLPTANLLAADDVLASAVHVDASVRRSLLARIVNMPKEELAASQRAIAIARYAPFLIDQGDAARAYTLLDSVRGQLEGEAPLLFQAAALSGRYDKAAEISAEAQEWVNLLSRTADRDLTAAAPLCNEINRRFAGRLAQEHRATVDQISQAIRRDASADATSNYPNNGPRP